MKHHADTQVCPYKTPCIIIRKLIMYYKSIVTTPIIGSIVKILVKRQCRKRLPAILEWVNEITTYYKQNAPYTSELNISRLPDYYPQPLLQNTQVAIVKRCPIPPFAKLPQVPPVAIHIQPLSGLANHLQIEGNYFMIIPKALNSKMPKALRLNS